MTKSQYFKNKLQHHEDAIAHHADMADKDINREYHLKQEAHHREAIDKLSEKHDNKKNSKTKPKGKDLIGSAGPVTSTPGSISSP
jgi:hypothetical protein